MKRRPGAWLKLDAWVTSDNSKPGRRRSAWRPCRVTLGAQWRRVAYSVALNIAEGAAQSSTRQFRRYLQIAKGSLDELEGVLELAEGYLSPAKLKEVRLARTHCARLLTALARSLSGNASPDNRQRLTR